MPYNLSSPNGIVEPCSFVDLQNWYEDELDQVQSEPERSVLSAVGKSLDAFIRWPGEALLLWPDCNRVPEPGKRQKYFSYPSHIRQIAKRKNVKLDTRPNGPAIAAFIIAGGDRPHRFGSSNAWSFHHLYSGKFSYLGKTSTTHATKECNHFTQSAGLIAVHPVADALVDEFPFFAWLLRAMAYVRFGYDPDTAFASDVDELGFERGRPYRIVAAT